jgi:hypothetical protein
MLPGNNKQKSLSRRFLLILGAALFVSIFALGLMVIFNDKWFPNATQTQKTLFGVFIMGYAILRLPRIFKKKDDEI